MQAVNCVTAWVSLYISSASPPDHEKYLLNCTAVTKAVGNEVSGVRLAVGESWRKECVGLGDHSKWPLSSLRLWAGFSATAWNNSTMITCDLYLLMYECIQSPHSVNSKCLNVFGATWLGLGESKIRETGGFP